jgi:hypothetical protein
LPILLGQLHRGPCERQMCLRTGKMNVNYNGRCVNTHLTELFCLM